MIMEAFSRLIAKAEKRGVIWGFKLEGREGKGTQVSHLLFVDDTLLFCKDNED